MRGIKLKDYDTADYLKTPEDAALFLEAAIEEDGDDPAYMAAALGAVARSGNMSELARKTHMSREGLYKALSPEGNPTFTTITRVCEALGVRIRFELIPATPH